MAVNFSSGFNITSNEAVDQRIIKTKAEMRSMSPADLARMPDKYFCMCADDGQIYFYDKEGDLKPETGYFTAFDSTVADDIKNSEEVQSALTGNIVKNIGESEVAKKIGVGVPTLVDMIKELTKPGRDIREEMPKPVLRSDLLSLEDLKEGMVLSGVVRNVIDFGAFVDIGVHQDGLVHISQICDRYIKHPSEVLKVGDHVQVKVLSVDPVKKRIALTMKDI